MPEISKEILLMFDYNLTLTSLSLLLCILIFSRSIFLRRCLDTKSNLLEKQTKILDEMVQDLNIATEPNINEINFENTLTETETNPVSEEPQNSFVPTRNDMRPPERYQYAQSMHRSGMQKEEISSTLGMSGNEISQILKLASIGCRDTDPQDFQENLLPA